MFNTFYGLNKYIDEIVCVFCVHSKLKEANYRRDQSPKQSQQEYSENVKRKKNCKK